MTSTDIKMISDLSDAELDSVAAGRWWFGDTQVAIGNLAAAVQANAQLNAAVVNIASNQGGNQSNNNNAGNQD